MTSRHAEDLSLFDGMTMSGMTTEQVWLRQVSVGGDAADIEVEAYILGLLHPDALQHDLIAQALNEHFVDHGGNHPVTYSDSARA